MKNFIVLLLIMIFLSPLSFLLATATPASPTVSVLGYGWGSPSSPTSAYPGYTDFPFYVEIGAVGSATPLSASISFPSGSPFITVGGNQAGVIQGSGYYLAIFYLTIPSSVTPGYYSAKVTVDYSVPIADQVCVESKTFNIQIPVSAVDFPIPVGIQGGTSGVSQPLVTGEGASPLTISVSNPSNNIVDNVLVNLTLPSGLMSETGKKFLIFTIPSIPPQETIQSTQLVNVTQNAIPGTYSLNYSVTFTNYLGYRYYATNSNITSGNANVTLVNIPLTLTIYPKTPITFYVTSTSATPSSLVSITLRANSSYNAFIESVTPQTSLTLLSSNFTPTTFQGTANFNYTFEVPQTLAPGAYPITFTITYEIFGQQQETAVTTFVQVNYYNAMPTLSDPTWSTLASPGTAGVTLTFLLTNPLPYPISDVNVTILPPAGMSSTYISYVVPTLSASGQGINYAQVPFTITLAQNVTPGYHEIPFVVSYFSSYGFHKVRSQIPVYVYPQSQLLALVSNVTVYQGTQAELPIVLVNYDPVPVSSVSAELRLTGLSVVGFSNQTFNMGPNSNATVVFTISAQGVGAGSYPATLTLVYNYEGVTKTVTYTIPINVLPAQNIVDVSITPTEVYYGTINNVTVRLIDTAQTPLNNVVLKLFGPSSEFSLSQNTVDIGTLSPGKSYTVTLNLLPTVSSTTPLPLSVEVQYLLPGSGVITQSYNFSLIATGLVDLVLQQPTISFSNGTLTVTGVLNNFGTASANFVTVYVDGNSTYIGSVPPNSPTPFSTTLVIPFAGGNTSTAKPHQVKIVVSYEDSIYQTHNLTYVLSFSPSATHFNTTFTNFRHFRSSNSLLPEIVIAILLVIVIVLAILLVLRKGKK
ncbi:MULTISPECIES: COG1361 S-layer family protein [Metallosphaera]|uniref:S-layer domain-like protein n=3 Tax=Metallosphaera TaxID=41980 RepID=A4YGY3_METS5|nr:MULTISPECIES: hypothetical protein [Metallosphaera]ABP95685.1 hypothetical protein Msed_1529 [Metallosphaera sedula DSM 5348]AIM27669.1 hypothetical protein HA72_1529 [Metallosphaera sedula]AKV74526.1 hypothetical protein MsedA_1551 [Metallosphaera sedula]AKV76765.1 hypothetical protein MsedB_1553 [Metallosphaera sedula]AKV79016.1 hypothetical protein MsedC_1551 [Metallosphaera sedula]